jgi:hypothetical protein
MEKPLKLKFGTQLVRSPLNALNFSNHFTKFQFSFKAKRDTEPSQARKSSIQPLKQRQKFD